MMQYNYMKILFDILPWAIGAGAAVAAFFLGKRKSKADAIATELANVEKAISIYRGITQDLKGEIIQYRSITEDLQKEIVQLKASLHKMYNQNKQLIEENKQLKNKMQQLEQKLDGMNR